MSKTMNPAVAELLAQVDETAKPGVEKLLKQIDSQELQERDPGATLNAVKSAYNLASTRKAGETLVEVFTPTERDHGWSSRKTVINICTEDAPFLVGSVTAAISRSDLSIDLLLHPILNVSRDTNGQIVGFAKDGGVAESWMHIEIDRITNDERVQELREKLLSVIADVHLSVGDWEAMRGACTDLASKVADEQASEFLAWLANDNFTFLGYQFQAANSSAPTETLGVLASPSAELKSLTERLNSLEKDDNSTLIITKTNVKASVHRNIHLDYIGVNTFDEAGKVTGEHQFLGTFSSRAYNASVLTLPIAGDRAREVIATSGFRDNSHSAKHLLQVLEEYPRDELFQDTVGHLQSVAVQVTKMRSRRSSRIFTRADKTGHFVSVLVYLPKDRYNTAVRHRIEALLQESYNAQEVSHSTRVSNAPLAQLHFIVRGKTDDAIPEISEADLQSRLADAILTWEEELVDEVHVAFGDDSAPGILNRYAAAFPEAYKEDVTALEAIKDIRLLESFDETTDFAVHLFPPEIDEPEKRVLTVAARESYPLTRILPVLTDLGVDVVDERPYTIRIPNGERLFISDFGLISPDKSAEVAAKWDDADWYEDFEETFTDVWSETVESDRLNSLVLKGGLTSREIVILRTLSMYVRQIGNSFSLEYIEQALVANPAIAAKIVALFEARFNPEAFDSMDARTAREQEISADIFADLEAVSSLDHDRIIRQIVGVINAVWRTNFYQTDAAGNPKSAVSLKINCAEVPGLPKPHPMAEIWVYSPEVEGVHMRFGKVARGGLRWSDRREDFRTEVLGLVKAQAVKNAVIVPAGSKGGFFGKKLPSPAIDRGAWIEAGKEAYRGFIRAMLDITDNRDGDKVIAPENVVRHDEDDPYLVVAADKGTAGFSDTANAISEEYGFWLDDAFASGGSAGYDHKGMAITARGAWESVKRHFREMGHNTQAEDFTVVGVGDMSGDVFGNGMLRSEHIRLVAAFDHRHVFVDPTPDAASTFVERQRLFDLPGSSWDDFDRSLMSEGGGVFPLSAKSVDITPQMREALGIPEETKTLTPLELKKAVLLAPVDLIWNGAIGTYIKGSDESHNDIGDHSNDAVRVNGKDLRVKVVGEGGNLGASQKGRVEAALHGIRINTDAIDNSGGVGASDREVNLKILLRLIEQSGRLTREARNELLYSMTDEVGDLVLRDNYEQNVLLGNSRANAAEMLPSHERLTEWLEERGDLEREMEALPSVSEVEERIANGTGLTKPEFAVLLAYSKLALKEDLGKTDVASDPWFANTLADYFPKPIQEQYGEDLQNHPLKAEIIINSVVNSMVNRGGITFAYRAADETGATNEQVAKAFVVAREVYDLQGFVAEVEKTDTIVPAETQTDLYLSFRRLLDRAARWFVHHRGENIDIGTEIAAFKDKVAHLSAKLEHLLQGDDLERFNNRVAELEAAGAAEHLAKLGAGLVPSLSLLDIIEQSDGENIDQLAEILYGLAPVVRFDDLLTSVTNLPQDDRWGAMARAAMRDDLYSVMSMLTSSVYEVDGASGSAKIDAWVQSRSASAMRVLNEALDALGSGGSASLATVSVALRRLRALI